MLKKSRKFLSRCRGKVVYSLIWFIDVALTVILLASNGWYMVVDKKIMVKVLETRLDTLNSEF